MDGIRILLIGLLLVAPAYGQVPQSCSTGEARCYQAQYEGACAQRTSSTVASCEAFINGLEGRAREDREARRAQGLGHNMISSFLSKDAIEQVRHQAMAKAIAEELARVDPTDPEALRALAVHAATRAERLDALRRVVKLQPGDALDVSFLVSVLRESRSPPDLLEGGEAAQKAYESGSGLRIWEMAATAISLYAEAGVPDRAEQLRQQARRDLEAASLADQLARVIGNDMRESGRLLSALCGWSIEAIAGSAPCARGVDVVKSAAASSGDRATARPLEELASRYQDILDGRVIVVN